MKGRETRAFIAERPSQTPFTEPLSVEFQQADFFNPPHTHKHPIGLRLLVILDKLGGKPAVLARVARFFASEAAMHSGRQASLLAPKEPVDALDDAATQGKLDLRRELAALT